MPFIRKSIGEMEESHHKKSSSSGKADDLRQTAFNMRESAKALYKQGLLSKKDYKDTLRKANDLDSSADSITSPSDFLGGDGTGSSRFL